MAPNQAYVVTSFAPCFSRATGQSILLFYVCLSCEKEKFSAKRNPSTLQGVWGILKTSGIFLARGVNRKMQGFG